MPNNQMTPQQCKKVLEEFIVCLNLDSKIKGFYIPDINILEALTTALKIIQAVDEAGEELPKKREIKLIKPNATSVECQVLISQNACAYNFNEALNLCGLALARYKLMVEELVYKENESLVASGRQIVEKHNEIVKLKSQLSALRGKVDVEKIKEEIRKWAQEDEAIDKFGDILLRYDCDDVGLLAQKLAEYFEEGKK